MGYSQAKKRPPNKCVLMEGPCKSCHSFAALLSYEPVEGSKWDIIRGQRSSAECEIRRNVFIFTAFPPGTTVGVRLQGGHVLGKVVELIVVGGWRSSWWGWLRRMKGSLRRLGIVTLTLSPLRLFFLPHTDLFI